MTRVLITVDTELSALFFQHGADADANFAASIEGRVGARAFGIGWQMDRLGAYGLTGVFFVDPMPALVYGPEVITRVVAPIVARGHEVQLHIHTEWLEWAVTPPVAARGQNIGDFTLEDQATLIALARALLIDAGAPSPSAFRAGNYGANDDTLRALATLGIAWDSSFNAAYLGNPCRIGLTPGQIDPVQHLGVNEVPVAGIFDRTDSIRHAQVCALSAREMAVALDHAAMMQQSTFAIVTHSFEMLSRDRARANPMVMRRFEALCAHVAAHPDLQTAGFADLPAGVVSPDTYSTRLSPSMSRRLVRLAEQAVGTLLYERRIRSV